MSPPSVVDVMKTPATADAMAAMPEKKPTAPRTGKQLWAAAQKKVHAYHAVTHEFEHRAKEKAAFGGMFIN